MVESGVFFQYSGFLGEKSLFLGEKVHSERDLSYGKSTEQRRVQKSTEEQRTVQYSRADQSREEKKRKE
ncbi:hypothetical protein DW742_02350 [Butyricicoccus sp. AM28-25]|nr:hypothetical protein DW742_02350 [Butyricicoccus sp. AM28-25]